MSAPFIVFALPRSRTYWLSHFLSFGDYHCYHEMCQFLRSMDDIRSWLSMDFTGAAETGAAPAWRIIAHHRPDMRMVVVRRAVEDVVESTLKIDLAGIGSFERARLEKGMRYVDHYLDEIEHEAPNVLSVRFDDLASVEGCGKVFSYCLPYRFDPDWWKIFAPMRLVVNSRAILRYRFAHRPQIDALKSELKSELRRLRTSGAIKRKA